MNWGILSTAHINRRLIPVIRASERGQLRAVASRDAGRAAAYAQEWQIPQAYGSYEALLADPEIDVVYISLPNHLHAAYAVK
ncbi:MAG: Gfo/Idh/MocA family oxidoreductase, partial [Saprospiraceae bacterium]|nr:Gfo/Idh/MocA family oxidoreductase [Saprospiraceae bacterium]